jgi:hypothetical protein
MKTRRLTTRAKRKTVAGLRRTEAQHVRHAGVARLVAVEASGRLSAELSERPGVLFHVRLGVALDRATLATLIERQRPVLLVSGDGDDTPWLVAYEHEVADPAIAAPTPTTAVVDGKRVELRGEDEIVLRCGEASITLRRNGRIVVRGTHVESSSKGINRIKGGAVQIN